MTLSLKNSLIILACLSLNVQADVSHLGYNRYNGNRNAALRLQRVESRPTPYPSSGYRPNREFNLPREQPLFPLANQQGSNTQQQQQQHHHTSSSGFDNLSEPQPKPQLVYGAPAVDNQGFHQQQPGQQLQNQRPQNSNGFNNFAQTQQAVFNGPEQTQFENVNGFSNFAESQQRPELLYGAPNNLEQQSNDFENLAQQQQQSPQYNYNSQARYRQLLIARLQQAQAQNQPQSLYSAPVHQQPQEIDTHIQIPAESQSSRLTAAAKPARLTDNREEREEETAESAVDIETTTTTMKDNNPAPNPTNVTAVAVNPIAAPANGLVTYYPATAFSYVQPFSASYVGAANYHTVQPVNTAYTLGSAFLPQQYTFAAAPAQLQAW